ncbi:unnamed protein product [Penicillium olsonii]|nr:unnamed protein product [Penicillium olsonii]
MALKAVTADASSDTPEANFRDTLRESSSTPGADIIPPLLDEFWVTGPNGKHKCIVTPPAQMGLTDGKEASDSGLFQPRVAQSIITQLIRGITFLHSNEIIHGGNILVQFSNSIDLDSTSEVYEKFGEPKSGAVLRVDGKPLSDGVPDHIFMPGWYGVGADKITHGNERILLSDFGESFNPHTTPRFSSSTPLLRPPEAYLSNETLSFSSDV